MRKASALKLMKSIFLLVLLLSLTSTTLAQENHELGRMWTFENPPLAYLEKEYGFKPDQEWLDSLRLGSLRLGGDDVLPGFGSASFVSPKGLIMTSTRCVRDAVADSRPREIDMIKTGFVAAELEDEFRLRSRRDEWLTAAQLYEISNVTDKVNKGVASTDNETQIKEKREANKQTILDAARKADPELVPQIVSLYQGGMFQLYQYKVYNDLRLVVLPHVQTAHFGGDADNFTYPRHSIDFAFLRAYEDGKPANSGEHYFKWKSGGAKKDELVFVSGNPGTTKRLSTKAQLELERDIRIPIEIERLTNRLPILKDSRANTYDGEFDPENPSKYWASMRTGILATESSLKSARGNLQGLKNAKLMAKKTAAEQAFKSRVMADKKLAEQYGDLWDRIASVVGERRQHDVRARFQTADGDAVLGVAVAIVRSCDPAETEEYRKQAKKKCLEVSAYWATEIHTNFHIAASFEDRLVRARNWLPKDDPFFSKVLAGKSAEEFMDVLWPPQSRRSPSWLGYAEQRDALIKSGWKAIQDSEDPAIVAARELVILMRKNEKLGDELDAKEEALGAELGQALLACYGTSAGSDGTMTPRFTDGVVRGFPTSSGVGGTLAPYRTTFYGLYARNAEFDNEYPFNLPKIWLDRKDKIDMTKPVNVVSTSDITRGNMDLDTSPYTRYSGGNSGSVVVNKALEVVGVVVDGNIESLHNDFVFTDDVPRAVSAHVDGIMEALVKIYDAHRVAKELTGK